MSSNISIELQGLIFKRFKLIDSSTNIILRSQIQGEEKLTTLEKERPDALEVAA